VVLLESHAGEVSSRAMESTRVRAFRSPWLGVLALILATMSCTAATPRPASKGRLLGEMTWVEAEQALTPDTVVVIPLGAESKEHGPHLLLENDSLLAKYFEQRVRERCDVVVAPTINYSFYPAFLEYPGSTSLKLDTARDVVVEIIASLARYGPKRFYVLNTGVSTVRALEPARALLAAQGIEMRYSTWDRLEPLYADVVEEQGGTHADEIETSMLLYIDPSAVDMSKAVDDFHPSDKGGLTRDPHKPGTYSASGVFGFATLATRAKGQVIVERVVAQLVKEIDELRGASAPPVAQR
jgi:creatinine amidohydrolase